MTMKTVKILYLLWIFFFFVICLCLQNISDAGFICALIHIVFLSYQRWLSVSILCEVVQEYDPGNYKAFRRGLYWKIDFSKIKTQSREVSAAVKELQSSLPYSILGIIVPFVIIILTLEN